MKPIDLSDGTHLPAGTDLLAPMAGIAVDERYYSDPNVFDGLRFYKQCQHQQKQREQQQQSASASSSGDEASVSNGRHHFTSIGNTNMNFGLGKHACPGRFFAGCEIKLVLALLLLRYDIRLKDGETRPAPNMFMMTKSPSMTAEIMFRRRTD